MSKDGVGGTYTIRGRAFDTSGVAIGTDFTINTTGTNLTTRPAYQRAAVRGGQSVVVWSSNDVPGDGSGGSIHYRLLDANGIPVGATDLIANTTVTSGLQTSPSVRTLPDGRVIFVWQSFESGTLNFYGRVMNTDGSWVEPEVVLASTTDAAAVNADVTTLSDGRFVLTWQAAAGDASGAGINTQIFVITSATDLVAQAPVGGGTVVATSTTSNWIVGDATHTNTLVGGQGTNNLFGGSLADTLVAGTGQNLLVGGEGNNTFRFGQTASTTNAIIAGGASTAPGSASAGAVNTLELTPTTNTSYDFSTATITDLNAITFSGTKIPGDPQIILSSNQFGDGLLALDTLFTFDANIDNVTILDGTPTVASVFDGSHLRVANVELAKHSFTFDASMATASATVIGSSANISTLIKGGSANDNLGGGAGDDKVSGGLGADTLSGGAGNDTLVGDGAVVLTEASASVKRLYLATLNRAPDDAGWQGWVDALNGGKSLASITSGFINSAEFQAVYGARDNTQFVTLLYNNVLHRAPDAGGLAGWIKALTDGSSRESVVNGFSESGEFQNNTNPTPHASEVYRLYGATLDRAPDAGGFTGWVDALDSTSSLNGVAGGFVNSAEFQAKYGALDNTGFVNLLYNNVLHRGADADGLKGWLDALGSGTTRTGVVLGFSESVEYSGTTAPAFNTYMQTAHPEWNDIIEGGAGNDILSGGHGANTYVFRATEIGTDQVYQFQSWDTLQFVGFGYADKAAGLSHMTQSGANVVFADKGETITFHSASLADVQTANWLLA